MITYKFIIQGIVQGVYYRKSIYENTLKKNIKGYVKNLSNGKVEAVANLDKENFDIFLDILKKGSSYSKINNISSSKLSYKEYKNFSIQY